MAKQNLSKRVTAFIACPKFFWGILALFVLQAAWIALSGRYPMAFDEDVHLGIIRLYTHHISPFWSAQPPGADMFGAVFRDPSYLYHWLMSFPYRFLNIFTDNQTTLVLWLRALNIALFVCGLALYRRLLLKTGASRAIVHGVLLVFVLVPVVPLLAAQINYDNLFLPLLGLLLLMVVNFDAELARKKRSNPYLLAGIVVLCLLGSLIKYAFLPIFMAIVVYLAVRHWQVFRSFHAIVAAKKAALKRIGLGMSLLSAGVIIIASGLFIERYGVNLVRYHAPVADCSQALSIDACSHYGPWIRDHILEQNKSPDAPSSPVTFAWDWLYGMWFRLFFSVGGPSTGFQTRVPFLVPGFSTMAFAVAGALFTLAYIKRLFRTYNAPVLSLLIVVTAVYVGVLWLDGYQAFMRTGVPVAINGRYLLPVLPFALLLGALAFNELCGRRESLKLLIGGIAVLSLLWGGGALTYILRSNPAWYWPGTPLTGVNETLQRDLGPLAPGYNSPTRFIDRD
jgi:hypothetical protein